MKKLTNSSKYMALSLLLYAFLTGCKKFIEIPPPNSQLVTASVFANNATATSAVTNIYTTMFNNYESSNMAIYNGLLADELTTYNTAGSGYFEFYSNQLTAVTAPGPWQNAYNYIYQANAIISGLQQYSGTSPAVKQQLMGEAYFIRAFWHFYLTDLYGAVPVALTTDYKVTSKLSRTPRVQVLQQVVADLQQAQTLLSKEYVDASDTTVTTDRVRPNKSVAEALLARAYLYLGDYDNHNTTYYGDAVTAATNVISNTEYSLCTNLSGPNSVFLANSTEAIWQLYTPLPTSINTQDGNNFILLAAPSTGGSTGSNIISPQLLNAFEPNDQRAVNWIGSINAGGNTYYFPYKYKVQSGSTVTEYTMVLRLAEQYLIQAEAYAELGQLQSALNDLNKIRNRAGLPNSTLTASSTQTEVLAAILHERQVEMFTEWGARWFDLNRTGNTNAVMGPPPNENVCQFKGGIWNTNGYQELYPIPQSEISVDNNLTQNAGY